MSKEYLRLHSVDVFVRDLSRSIRFFTETLGFEVAFDVLLQSGQRCVGVAPQDGTAVLTLIQPEHDTPAYKWIGRPTGIMFVTEDIAKTFVEWTARGVRFRHTPKLRRVNYRREAAVGRLSDPSVAHGDQSPVWGQVFTRFEDVDRNTFSLVSFDEVSKAVEAQRRIAAEKAEAERRAAHEIEIARQVQYRLFPQSRPPCKTLEYSGKCAQARQVGGDYFDFFSLGEDRTALVVADVAGKGIAAALLMANLQANLRSQCLTAASDPERFLCSVNQLFYENSPEGSYATLFFAEYSESKRLLRYINCGHLSGLVLQADDHVQRLTSTTTVVGLFDEWECSAGERKLACGDILVLYTDGITEVFNEADEEFGEAGVLASVRKHRSLPAEDMIDGILADVSAFSPAEQQDDMTLLVARCTGEDA